MMMMMMLSGERTFVTVGLGFATPTLPWLARYMMVQRRAQYMTVLKVKKFLNDVYIYDDKRKMFIYICEI